MAIKTLEDLRALAGGKRETAEQNRARQPATQSARAPIMMPTAQKAMEAMERGKVLMPRSMAQAAPAALARAEEKRATALPLPGGRNAEEELRSEVRQRTQLGAGVPAAQVAGQISTRQYALKTGKEAWEASEAGIKARAAVRIKEIEKQVEDTYAEAAQSGSITGPSVMQLEQERKAIEAQNPSLKRPGLLPWLGKNIEAGIQGVGSGLAATYDFLLPTELIFGEEKDPMSGLNRDLRSASQNTTRLADEMSEKKGGLFPVAGKLTQGTVSALPNAALALATGGASIPAQGALLGAQGTGLGTTVSTAMSSLARNPGFWMANAQTLGNSYESAKAGGANEVEAAAVAIINSFLSSAVEVGGGIETLPTALARDTSEAGVRKWVRSMLEEGGEEVVQSVIEGMTQKAVYDREKPVASIEDENAIINPKRMAGEFAMGTAVGGLLGGAQIGVQKAASMMPRAGNPMGGSDYSGSRAIRMPTAAEGNVMPMGTAQEAPGQQKTASTGETVREGLVPLSEAERNNLSTGKNNIVSTAIADIVSFAKRALSNKGGPERLYMGKIPAGTADFVRAQTGVDISGYNAILPGDSVQHTIMRHGDQTTEAARGQRAITTEDFAQIPAVITDPDSVTLSDSVDKLGRRVLLFSKQIGDTFVTAQAVTDGRRALTTNSIWAQKKKNPQDTTHNADVAADPVHNAQSAPPQGSSDTTIQQRDGGVKGEDARKMRGLRMPGGDMDVEGNKDGATPFKTGISSARGLPGGATPSDISVHPKAADVKQAAEAMGPRPLPGGKPEANSQAVGNLADEQWDSILNEGTLPELEHAEKDHMTPTERDMWEKSRERAAAADPDVYRGTPTTDKLGIKVAKPITDLGLSQALRGQEKARYQAGQELNRVLKENFATDGEREFARGIANGYYTMRDVPARMNRQTVKQVVDAMRVLDGFNKSTLKDQKARTNWDYDAKIEALIKNSDKKTSPGAISLNANTMQRNNERTWGKDAAPINAELFDPISANEAERIRFVNRTLGQMEQYRLNNKESAMVQQLMEGKVTEGELLANGFDAKRLAAAAKTLSGIYSDFYGAINDFLVAHGYKEIGFQKNYAPHMQEDETGTLQRYLQRMGFQTEVNELPTDLAGRTDTFKPGKQYNPYFQARKGGKTVYDAVGGLESYVNYLSNVFYHTDDIQKLRRFSEAIRAKYSGENISAALDQLRSLENRLVSDELDKSIDPWEQFFENQNRYKNMTKFGNYVSALDDYTNILAGKQAGFDRAIEKRFGREKLNWGRNVQNAFAKAAIVGNLSSAISQTVQLPQLVAEVGPRFAAQAISDVTTGKTGRDGFTQESDFLTGKKGIQSISEKTRTEKVFDFAAKPFEWVDDFASRVIVRAKYLEQVAKGAAHTEAMAAADRFANRLVGSRTKGARPLIFEDKNVLSKLVTTFQLEVANGWQHVVHDLPMEIRNIAETKGKAAAAQRTTQLIVAGQVSAFIANVLIKALTGREPVPFDGIGMLANYFASGFGMTKEEYMKTAADNAAEAVAGKRVLGTEEKDRNFNASRAVKTAGQEVLDDVPYLNNIMNLFGGTGGRLPLPQIWNSKMKSAAGELGKALTAESEEERSEALGKALPRAGEGIGDIVATWAPMGSQIKKSVQGGHALLRGGVYSGYGEDEELRYPVEQTPANAVRGTFFGRGALPETDRYYAEQKSTLTPKQTAAYESLLGIGMKRGEAYDAMQELKGVKKTDDTGRQLGQIMALRGMAANDEQKKVMYRAIITDSRDDEVTAASRAKVAFDTYLDAHAEYLRLNAKEGNSANKATEFSHWLNGQELNGLQYTALRDSFKFYSQVPNESTAYEKMIDTGVPKDVAYQMAEELDGLKPKDGKNDVSQVQRGLAIARSQAKPAEQMDALSAVLNESLYQKTEQAVAAKIDTAIFLEAYEAQSGMKGDKDAAGKTIRLSESRKKKDAIDAVAGTLDTEQRFLLYELLGVSKEVWGAIGLPGGRSYVPRGAGGQQYVPRDGKIYMPRPKG